jgi:hypothetical protein
MGESLRRCSNYDEQVIVAHGTRPKSDSRCGKGGVSRGAQAAMPGSLVFYCTQVSYMRAAIVKPLGIRSPSHSEPGLIIGVAGSEYAIAMAEWLKRIYPTLGGERLKVIPPHQLPSVIAACPYGSQLYVDETITTRELLQQCRQDLRECRYARDAFRPS